MDATILVNRKKELQELKKSAKEIEARLRSFEKRIRDVEHGLTPSVLKAIVDPDKCISCGTCQGLCPTGAISMGHVARVDPLACKGCGLCVEECPQWAISLHPAATGDGKTAVNAS